MTKTIPFCVALSALLAACVLTSTADAQTVEVSDEEKFIQETVSEGMGVADAAEMTQEAKTEINTEIVADEEVTESLIPEDEEEMMASHPVGAGKIEFKPGKGLAISSSDGDFQLKTRVRVQMLYTLEKHNLEDPLHNLRMRRARIVFQRKRFR